MQLSCLLSVLCASRRLLNDISSLTLFSFSRKFIRQLSIRSSKLVEIDKFLVTEFTDKISFL